MKNNKKSILAFSMFFLFISCQSLSYEKNIIDKYYLIGVDMRNHLIISRKLSTGDYIGRVPGDVTEFGVTDSFIVAKSESNGLVRYFIINMKKDSEYALEEEFLIGPLTEKQYIEEWGGRLEITLKNTE